MSGEATTFEIWWEKNHVRAENAGVDRVFAEELWNDAQEAVLRPLLSAGDEEK